jgi:hypothetical protein
MYPPSFRSTALLLVFPLYPQHCALGGKENSMNTFCSVLIGSLPISRFQDYAYIRHISFLNLQSHLLACCFL